MVYSSNSSIGQDEIGWSVQAIHQLVRMKLDGVFKQFKLYILIALQNEKCFVFIFV